MATRRNGSKKKSLRLTTQTKDFKLVSPIIKKILSKHPEITTLHIRRTIRDDLCLVGINGKSFGRMTKGQNPQLSESDKSLLVEMGVKYQDLKNILDRIHHPWINKIIAERLPSHKGTMFARYLTFSQEGKVEIHKKVGKPTKNDPRKFCQGA